MKQEDRKAINKVQINRFFQSYYTEWRHIQLLSIQKLLKEKYSFYAEIVEQTKKTDSQAGEATITQEITNGLLFDAIQSNLQHIEDLFALIRACEKPDFFIAKIAKYDAGKITSSIKQQKFVKKKVLEQFYFPNIESDSDVGKKIDESAKRLCNILSETVEFYKTYAFFYNQYKHGLTIALRPYRNFDEKETKLDKEGKLGEQPLVAIDSLNFKDAPKNQYGFAGYLLIPDMQLPVATHMKELQRENNLLRFVKTPPGMTTIDHLVKQADKTKRCIQILIHNFQRAINDENPLLLRLPAEKDDEVYEFQFQVEPPVTSK